MQCRGKSIFIKTFWNCDILVYSSRNCRLDWILQNVSQRFESSMKYSYMCLLSLCPSLHVGVCLLYGHMVARWHTFNFQSGSDHCNRSIKTITTLYRNNISFITRQFEGSVTNYISCANDGTGLKYRWQPALSHETWINEDLTVPLVCINLNDTCKTFPGYWWNKHKILQCKIIMMEGSGFYFSSSQLKTHSLV